MGFDDSLRGYGHSIYKRDGFRCAYCGVDGTQSFELWLSLSVDHLLPKGHALREDERFIVTACRFCNNADNRFFDLAASRGVTFEGKSREELVAQRREYVRQTREEYRKFWETNVRRHAMATGG